MIPISTNGQYRKGSSRAGHTIQRPWARFSSAHAIGRTFEHFYPRGLKPNERLGYYPNFFPLVEVDSTFYRLMPPHNYELWAERTPDDFVVQRQGVPDPDAARRRVPAPAPATPPTRRSSTRPTTTSARSRSRSSRCKDAGKLRAILFQFPPWFRESEAQPRVPGGRARALPGRRGLGRVPPQQLARPAGARRHVRAASRARPRLRRGRSAAARVGLDPADRRGDQPGAGDRPLPRPQLQDLVQEGRRSSTERFNYLYSENELADWVPKIEQLAEQVEEVHVLMNNNRGNYAIVNAQDAMRLLGQPNAAARHRAVPAARARRRPRAARRRGD